MVKEVCNQGSYIGLSMCTQRERSNADRENRSGKSDDRRLGIQPGALFCRQPPSKLHHHPLAQMRTPGTAPLYHDSCSQVQQ